MTDHPRPGLDTVRGIVAQVAKGLQAFHGKEMLHQDLRPENVMIDRTGTVRSSTSHRPTWRAWPKAQARRAARHAIAGTLAVHGAGVLRRARRQRPVGPLLAGRARLPDADRQVALRPAGPARALAGRPEAAALRAGAPPAARAARLARCACCRRRCIPTRRSVRRRCPSSATTCASPGPQFLRAAAAAARGAPSGALLAGHAVVLAVAVSCCSGCWIVGG